MFIDYSFYLSRYPDGSVTAEQFSGLCYKAQREIENAVAGAVDVDDDVKECTAELIHYLAGAAEDEAATASGITSERVGDYSVSYASASEKRAQQKATKAEIIKFWLGKSGLNYRGVARHVL